MEETKQEPSGTVPPAPAQQSSSEESSDSSEGSTNQPDYDRPEFQDAQDPFA